jgi:hypothetical protein
MKSLDELRPRRTGEPRPIKDDKTKMSRQEDAGGIGLVIYYKQYKDPKMTLGPDEFGKIVQAVTCARMILKKTAELLAAKDPLVEEVLRHHFKVSLKSPAHSGFVKLINERFELIVAGFNQQTVICVSKNLDNTTRGETTAKSTMCINRKILDDDEAAIARTIIHEGAHKFANVKSAYEEIYEDDKRYGNESPDSTIYRADSYAWAALSLFSGRLLTGYNFDNTCGALKDVSPYGD